MEDDCIVAKSSAHMHESEIITKRLLGLCINLVTEKPELQLPDSKCRRVPTTPDVVQKRRFRLSTPLNQSSENLCGREI